MNIIERIKEIFQKMPKKLRRGLAIGGTIAATTSLAVGCGAEKDAQEANNIKVEQESNFKDQIKYDVEKEANQATEQSNVEKANQLKTAEEVKEFLKDVWIEQYKEKTGDTAVSAKDIEIPSVSYQDYVYINEKTGEIITHGEKPEETEQKLKRDGISYTTEDDVQVYKIVKVNEKGEEEKVLDCITLQSKDGKTVPAKVILGDQYEDKEYTSIIAEMGMVIPCGVDYAGNLEKGNENDIAVGKKEFVKAVQEFENGKQNQNATQKLQVGDEVKIIDENLEKGFEHE